MKAKQLRELIVRPMLEELDQLGLIPCSPVAEDLIMGTACAESHCGYFIRQETNDGYGVARGIYQMEPSTEIDILNNYISYRRPLADFLNTQWQRKPELYDMEYATFMCRVHYFRESTPLPQYDKLTHIRDLGAYWKAFYNTEKGAGTVEGFIEKCHKYGDII